MLNLGKVLAAGTPAEIRSHREVVSAYLGALSRCCEITDLCRRLRQDRRAARHRSDDRRRARSWRCSAPTAPARPRCCAPCPACCRASGQVRFAGRDLAGAGPRETARAGLVHVVEGHRVFTQLSVSDNLLLAGYGLPRGERAARVEEALALFPEIAAKRQRPRRRPVRRPAADAGGGAGPGAAAAAADAGRAVRRPVAGAGRPRAGRGRRSCARPGTAVLLVEQLIEKALAAGRPRLCAGARLDRAGGADQRSRPAAPAGARLFRAGCGRAAVRMKAAELSFPIKSSFQATTIVRPFRRNEADAAFVFERPLNQTHRSPRLSTPSWWARC